MPEPLRYANPTCSKWRLPLTIRHIDVPDYHASPHHLDRYGSEFTFRLNEGDMKNHTMERLASLFSAAIGKRLTLSKAGQTAMVGNPSTKLHQAEAHRTRLLRRLVKEKLSAKSR